MSNESTITVNTGDELNFTIGGQNIEVAISDQQIEIELASVGTANYVAEGGKFYFDGAGGTTYLTYNPVTEKLEAYVKGIKQADWGSNSSNPFA